MKIMIKLFARAKDLAQADVAMVELPERATVGQLRQALALANPSLASLVQRCAVAVDSEFADDAHLLSVQSEVALLPPVSGG